jgi:hypothetical protein
MRIPSRLSASTTALYALAVSAALGFSTAPGWADDNQGNQGNGVSATATNHDDDGDQNHGAVVSAVARGHGHHRARSAISADFAGLVPVNSNTTTYLRLTNLSDQAGVATVTLRSAATGATLGTWTSVSLAAHTATQVDLADIAAHASPVLTAADAGDAVDLTVSTTFGGTAQAVLWNTTGGSLTNMTPCAAPRIATSVIGYIEGGSAANVTGALRLANNTDTTHHTVLTIVQTSDGTTLGTWTSPDVPAGASLTMTAAAIAAAATPAVPAASSYTFIAQPGDGLRMQHIVSSGPNAVVADLTGVCRVRPATTEE